MHMYEVGDLFWDGDDEYEIVMIIHTDSDDIYHCRDQVTKQAYIFKGWEMPS